MKQLKKTLLTLVALLAVTTGAWAEDIEIEGGSRTISSDVSSGYFYMYSGTLTIDQGATVTLSSYFYFDHGSNIYLHGTLQGGVNDVTWNDGCVIHIYLNDGAKYTLSGATAPSDACQIYYGYDAATDGNGTVSVKNGAVEVTSSSTGNKSTTYTFTATPNSGYKFKNWTKGAGGEVLGTDASINVTCEQNGQYQVYANFEGGSSASSGPEVAWNKAEKTGWFTMPGGNVTLEPEYYPQAALAAAPTAINDVPATTDGAIVNAGTVANIGETANAQGTVMYHVSQTALDDAALLALAADQWTADVPTAADLAQGQAYVYYYVRGNDSDNDDENFSDGDILAANALTVTIAAEPTYAVTFADGVNPEPPAEPEWTASPAADVKKGQTVTVTYTGTKKVIGVKAEKKAPAVTVTWNYDDITGTGKSFTKDGVTITAGNIDFSQKNFMQGGTFTTTLGNFTKIEVSGGNSTASGEGWSGDNTKKTWTGNASSVSFSGKIHGNGEGTLKFVFTIEPTN